MKRAMVQLAVAGLVLSALGFQSASTTLSFNSVSPRITQAVDEKQRVVLKGNTHPLARAQFDHGEAPADLPLNRMLLVLKRSPEQESALRQLLDEQQDKSSPNYHKWLTPDEFGKKFGPADQDIQVTTNWLRQHGFQIGKVARGRTVVEFSGTAAQVQETFGTSIHKYVVKGKDHWANANDPQIPAALAPVVAGVASLHNFERKPRIARSPNRYKLDYNAGSQPHITAPDGEHALGPGDFAVIYNVNPLYDATPVVINGAGTTIAVVGRTNINWTDIFDFRSIFNRFGGSSQAITNGPDPGELGGDEELEADLDNSWSAAVAPGANIDFVISATTNTTDGVVLSELYIVDNNFADIMTESFGTCEAVMGAGLAEAEMIAQQAAAQGTTFFASSGDSGAASCDDPNSSFETGGLSVSVPASTPYTVGVGGTEFNEGSNSSKYWSANTNTLVTALSYIPENVWNESCNVNCPRGVRPNLAATGGGVSQYTPQPTWQSGVRGVPADGHRHVPDVALTAAVHDPYLFCGFGSCDQGFFFAAGGTSASAPSFAGIMALIDQKMGGRQGLANYVLYQLARAENYSSCNASSGKVASTCVFNDVTVGNNGVPGESGYPTSSQYASGAGFDMATGLGSVNVNNLVKSWAATTFNSTVTTLSPSSITGTHGQPQTITISVTSPSGIIPSGNVSLISDTSPFGMGAPTINLCTSTNGCTLDASGNLTTSTSLLPGGSYSVHAHYPGNGSLSASDSSPSVPVTINSEPSVTKLTVAGGFIPQTQAPTPLPGTISYGTFVYLRADVAGTSLVGLPTGSVNFLDNGFYSGIAYQLNTEGAAASSNGFFGYSVGAHSVTANYLGDSSFQSSVSTPPFVFSVTPASSSIALSYTGATRGANLNATVLTNSGGDSPTGTVSLSVDGTPVNNSVWLNSVSAVINPLLYVLFGGAPPIKTGAQATAAWLDSALANGKHTLQATYAGDTNYAGSSASFAFNLQPDFTLTADNNFIGIPAPGGAGSLMLTVGGLDGFNGTVNFSCSGLPAESACNFSPTTVKGSGTTLMTVTSTPPKSSGLYQPRRLELWASASGFGIAGMFLLGAPATRRRGRKIVGFVAFLVVLGALGCGGGSSSNQVVQHDPGTTPGTYNVTIKASSGSLVRSAAFQLLIQ